MKKFFDNAFIVMFVLVLVFLLGCLAWVAYRDVTDKLTTYEVERYTVGAEVSHSDYTSYHKNNHGTITECVIAVRNDDFSTVFNVSAETYAKYVVGDVVEVEVREMASNYNNWFEYYLIG
jgi:NOL1/NOP2/fmu family ribosome biogenesis protein